MAKPDHYMPHRGESSLRDPLPDTSYLAIVRGITIPASHCGPLPFDVLSAQEKDLAGLAAFGKFFFATGVMLALSGFALIGFAPFLFLLGIPLIILGGIVWIRAKWKARGLKGGADL